MNLRDYQTALDVFAKYPASSAIQYCLLGAIGEAGEVANQVKKILRDDDGELTEARRIKLIDEAGDVCWYVTRLATELGHDLDDCQPVAPQHISLDEATLQMAKSVVELLDFQELGDIQDALDAIAGVAYFLDTTFEYLLTVNIDKLTGRLARGTIGGSGDVR
jgi:NTP pyrophosphatase (non-canonical NTP hydrolase)